jgi:hypothetical protein
MAGTNRQEPGRDGLRRRALAPDLRTSKPNLSLFWLWFRPRPAGAFASAWFQSRRVSDGLGQHCIQLRLGEFLRLPCHWLARRHYLMNWVRTGRQKRWPSVGHRHDLGLCGWRLVPALQAHAQQLSAHGVPAVPQAAGDLPGTVATGPEFFEDCNVGGIPHGYSLTPKVRVLTISPRLALKAHPGRRSESRQ